MDGARRLSRRRVVVAATVAVVAAHASHAQAWSRVGGLPFAWSVALAPDGGVFLLGTQGPGVDDGIVVRFDPAGNVAWACRPDLPLRSDSVLAAALDGGAVIGARVGAFPADPVVLRLASDGAIAWALRFDGLAGCEVRAIDAAPDGDVVAALTCATGGPLIVRLAPDGAPRWASSLPVPFGYVTRIVGAADGATYIAADNSEFGDPWVARLDPSGTPGWRLDIFESCCCMGSQGIGSLVLSPDGLGVLASGGVSDCWHPTGGGELRRAWIASLGPDGSTGQSAEFAAVDGFGDLAQPAAGRTLVTGWGNSILELDATLVGHRRWTAPPNASWMLSGRAGMGWIALGGSQHSMATDGDPIGCGVQVASIDLRGVPVPTTAPWPITANPRSVTLSPLTPTCSDVVLAPEPCGAPPGEVQGLLVGERPPASQVWLTWDSEPTAVAYRVYVGTLTALRSGMYDHVPTAPAGSCRVSTPAFQTDRFANPPGAYYLVAAVNDSGEGPLGFDSLGAARPPTTAPCP